MRSEPSRLGVISLDFAGIPPRQNENFPYKHAQESFLLSALFCFTFASFCFAFQMLIK